MNHDMNFAVLSFDMFCLSDDKKEHGEAFTGRVQDETDRQRRMRSIRADC